MAVFYEDVLQALTDRNVRFVIVGGTAVVLRGVPRMTADLDLVVDLTAANVNGLVDALAELGYRPRVPVEPRQLADPTARASWYNEKGMMAFSFWHPDRPLDAVDILYAGRLDYGELVKNADVVQVGQLSLPVAASEDLISMKSGTGRAQDEADADALRRLLDADQQA
jgi:hypothetical protein